MKISPEVLSSKPEIIESKVDFPHPTWTNDTYEFPFISSKINTD